MRLISWSCFSLLSLINISGKSWMFSFRLVVHLQQAWERFDCAGAWSGRCSCLHTVVLTGRGISAGVSSLQSEAELPQPPCQGTFTCLCLQHVGACDDFGCFLLWTTRHLSWKFRIKSPVSFNIRQPGSNVSGINPQN